MLLDTNIVNMHTKGVPTSKKTKTYPKPIRFGAVVKIVATLLICNAFTLLSHLAT